MTPTLLRALLLIVTLVFSAGCVESSRQDATGKAAIRGINAIVAAPDVSFKIEERTLQTLAYGAVSETARYDDLSYQFNFDATIPGRSSTVRLASRALDVVRDTNYLFALTGTMAAPQIVLWEQAERDWDESETVFELNVAHLARSVGPVDVYVAADGVAPAAGNALATVGNGDLEGPFEFDNGDYVVTVTPAGDPQTILFVANERTFTPATTDTLMVLDPDPSLTAGLGVRLLTSTGTSIALADPRFPPRGRVVHAAAGIGNVDLAENDDFANLVAANLAFGEFTPDRTLSPGTNSYTFTDAGNQGAPIVEEDELISAGTYETLILVGPAADPEIVNLTSIRRPFSVSARLGLVNLVSGQEAVDVYILPAGTAVGEDTAPAAQLLFKGTSGVAAFEAQDYEITVTELADRDAVLAGPEPLTLNDGDVLSVLILETADPNVATLQTISYAP